MIYPRQLTIQLRKRQLKDIYGVNIIYAGTNPLNLTPTPGSVDGTWYDYTDYVEGLQDVQLEWTVEETDFGQAKVGEFAPIKGVSGALSFEREAYEFLKSHLIEDVAAPLNQVEVQITDTACGRYIGYVIKSTQLEWCEFNSLCVFNLTLKQIEDYTNCIERTIISDNWQGWFQPNPAGGKKHPRFSYCIEKRPNWTIVLLWQLSVLLAVVVSLIYTVFYPILLVIWILETIVSGIVVVINFIIGIINTIIDFINTLGAGLPNIDPIPAYDPGPAPVTPVEVFLNWATTMMEVSGCTREHPAPLIRDYILNVCNKCGVRVDASTADVFFAPIITMTHSDNLLHTEPNPFYNACYLHATVKRGIRRFRKVTLFSGTTDPDTTTYYQTENAPVLSLDMFLNELNKVYNTQWLIQVDGTGTPWLWIKRKDYWRNQPPLYDFSQGGSDRSKIVEGICYEPQEIRLPASVSFLYSDDTADKCGVEAGDFYNGVQLVSFNNTTLNPIFKGTLDKLSGFGAARFNCDGATGNYLYDALQVVYSLQAINPFALVLGGELGTQIERYANYKLLMQSHTMALPKILIWDGDTDTPSDPNYLNATAIRDKINIDGTVYTIGKSGYTGTVAGITTPDPNPFYPSQLPDTGGTSLVPSTIPFPTSWVGNHFPNTAVQGQFPPFGVPTGVYAVTNIVGATLVPAAAILVNYPMYYEPHYKGTLWDKFHFIDDPYRNPRLNKKWRLKIPLCCEDLQRLNLTDNVNGQKLLSSVLLDVTFYNIGVITAIKAGYNTGDNDNQGTGQYIEISGVV